MLNANSPHITLAQHNLPTYLFITFDLMPIRLTRTNKYHPPRHIILSKFGYSITEVTFPVGTKMIGATHSSYLPYDTELDYDMLRS